MPTADALVLGCSGAGKTVLIRQLRVLLAGKRGGRAGAKAAAAERAAFSLQTTPTVGVEIHKLAALRLREVGAPMAATWRRYATDARMVVFVVDLARADLLASAAAELLELLLAPPGHGAAAADTVDTVDTVDTARARRPLFAVFLNKSDAPHPAAREDVDAVLRLGDLSACLAQPLPVFRGSAATGEGCEALLSWIVASKQELLLEED